jgi:hypothetical protein
MQLSSHENGSGFVVLGLVNGPYIPGTRQDNSNRHFPRVNEQQTSLRLDAGFSTPAAVVPELLDEIAVAWSLPLGQRVEVCFRGCERSAVTGILALLHAPDFPWNPQQALQLGIDGYVFSSREIERWTKI